MKLLSKNHIISGNEWFRQKIHDPYGSDNYAISKFIGKWTSIKYLLGQVWFNKRLKDLDDKDNSFLNTYEFILFDDEIEQLIADTYTYKDMKSIDGKMYSCYKSWTNWTESLINTMSKDEINYINNTPSNQCPYCKQGVIIEKSGRYGKFNGCSNFPKCRYSENKLSDTYSEYIEKKEFLDALKFQLKQTDLKKLNIKFLKVQLLKEE